MYSGFVLACSLSLSLVNRVPNRQTYCFCPWYKYNYNIEYQKRLQWLKCICHLRCFCVLVHRQCWYIKVDITTNSSNIASQYNIRDRKYWQISLCRRNVYILWIQPNIAFCYQWCSTALVYNRVSDKGAYLHAIYCTSNGTSSICSLRILIVAIDLSANIIEVQRE